VPPADPQALADGLNAVLALPVEERAQMGAIGRRRVQEMFDLEAVTRRYEALYETIVRRPGRVAKERNVERLEAARAV
jgi:glycosyltransferase involved in cell wall biosynthesis